MITERIIGVFLGVILMGILSGLSQKFVDKEFPALWISLGFGFGALFSILILLD